MCVAHFRHKGNSKNTLETVNGEKKLRYRVEKAILKIKFRDFDLKTIEACLKSSGRL